VKIGDFKQFSWMFLMFCLITVMLLCDESFAHHPTGASSSHRPDTKVLLSGLDNKPDSQVYSGFRLNHLDESVGQIYTAFLGGEYAFSNKLSVQLEIPFLRLNHNFRADETGIGDISLGGKYVFHAKKSWCLAFHSFWTFPSGDESSGLGRGAVGQQAGVSLTKEMASVSWLAGLSATWGYESSSEPTLSAIVGLLSPRFFEDNVVAGIFVSNESFLKSDVFTNGSGKVYFGPQLYVYLGQNDQWTVSLGAEISMFDYLERKAGVALTNTSFALLSDVLASVTFGLNYSF
jgi:hypothetical protein